MAKNNAFKIYWTQVNHTTFMYGSEVQFNSHTTQFINPMMPSGIIIHEWLMKANYFKDRIIPALPILRHNAIYELQMNYNVTPQNSVYFKIIFYRKNETILDTIIIKSKHIEFTFPEEAHTYKIQLMNSGLEQIIFYNMTIKEKEIIKSLDELTFSNIQNENELIKVRNIIITEPSLIPQNSLIQDSYSHIENVIVIDNWFNENVIENIQKILDYSQILQKNYKVNFIGYSAKSNAIVNTIRKMNNLESYTTFHKTKDMFLIEQLKTFDASSTENNGINHIYVTESIELEDLKLIQNVMNQSKYLKYLNKFLLNSEVYYEALY